VTLADITRLPEQRIYDSTEAAEHSTAWYECVTGSLAICLIVYVTAGVNAGDPYRPICKSGSKILGGSFRGRIWPARNASL